MNICETCSAYIKGSQLCKNGFPLQYGEKPMCEKEDFSDNTMLRFFDLSGWPLFMKEKVKHGNGEEETINTVTSTTSTNNKGIVYD